jgi:hypothetical protein
LPLVGSVESAPRAALLQNTCSNSMPRGNFYPCAPERSMPQVSIRECRGAGCSRRCGLTRLSGVRPSTASRIS